jgi:hypothetical protein
MLKLSWYYVIVVNTYLVQLENYLGQTFDHHIIVKKF